MQSIESRYIKLLHCLKKNMRCQSTQAYYRPIHVYTETSAFRFGYPVMLHKILSMNMTFSTECSNLESIMITLPFKGFISSDFMNCALNRFSRYMCLDRHDLPFLSFELLQLSLQHRTKIYILVASTYI
jgi:hypothetical protein